MLYKLTSGVTLALLLSACSVGNQSEQPLNARPAAIAAHLQFLASDELEGRDTGSRGHQIASNYIASQFQALGLAPAGDNNSYFQQVPLRSARLQQESVKLSFQRGDQTRQLSYPQQFFSGATIGQTEVAVTAPLVFVSYGLVSEEFALDDYAGLDVEGKIVVQLAGLPASLPSEERAYLGSIKGKLAAERGAIGVITIHTPQQEKTRPYANSLLYLNTPRLAWLNAEGEPGNGNSKLQAGAYLHPDAAASLFEQEQQSLADIFSMLEADQHPRGFELSSEAGLSSASSHQQISSPNVVALLQGSDPDLRNEYVVITAHSDHIGFSNDLRSDDKINNGAMDNAAGMAILLETARMFSELAVKPKRSILFVVVTAEERGLLGADYFAHNPTRPMQSLVANVNLDMPVLLYPFADLIAFGANHSTLGDVVANAAAKEGIALSADPMPEQAIFTRSDHFTLVKQGVPAVFLMTGFTSKDPQQDGAKIWGSFFAKHYHKPSDDIATLSEEYGPIRYDAGAVFADINFNIALDIANTPQRPLWKADSFFNKVFGKDYNRQ
ncbi:Zn-dependent amino- or carboxypeptidase, M28 family [Arsukibacterium tuosuense]|uniref:Zn-dependent amino- or carboxypeptidase, M28 family n=1 Tax=Arsukibacterium tuosuense TaxID=1323745 RepID=A0A285IER6_9GAMM|nr:M28 family metallopeptidase [Arsukibacterium tuosuense]SNY46442.1 Zn-dependent amino- or carboxypeptidase, M28 family [Arsukibacterium tuosuense]